MKIIQESIPHHNKSNGQESNARNSISVLSALCRTWAACPRWVNKLCNSFRFAYYVDPLQFSIFEPHWVSTQRSPDPVYVLRPQTSRHWPESKAESVHVGYPRAWLHMALFTSKTLSAVPGSRRDCGRCWNSRYKIYLYVFVPGSRMTFLASGEFEMRLLSCNVHRDGGQRSASFCDCLGQPRDLAAEDI